MEKETSAIFITAVIGPTILAFLGGIGWWFKTKREDSKEAEDFRRRRYETLEGKTESLLSDAIAREKEYSAQLVQRALIDARQAEVLAANSAALKENTLMMARLSEAMAKMEKDQ